MSPIHSTPLPEMDVLKIENLHLRMRILQQEFDLAQVRVRSELARLNQELNGAMLEICERLHVNPEEYDFDLAQRAFVPNRTTTQ